LSDITKWWTDDVIRKDVYIHDGQTFYTRYGDYLGRIACLIVGLLLLINVLSCFPIGIFKQQKG
jgi:apolipoprotein N-acyltransferase